MCQVNNLTSLGSLPHLLEEILDSPVGNKK